MRLDSMLGLLVLVSIFSMALLFDLVSVILEDMIRISGVARRAGQEVTFKHLKAIAEWVAVRSSGARILQALLLIGGVALAVAGTTLLSGGSLTELFLGHAGPVLVVLNLCLAFWFAYQAVTMRSSFHDEPADSRRMNAG